MIIIALTFVTCMGGGSPSPPPMLPPAPQAQDPGVVAARDSERARRRAVASNTILTSYKGVPGVATTAPKTLLGQ